MSNNYGTVPTADEAKSMAEQALANQPSVHGAGADNFVAKIQCYVAAGVAVLMTPLVALGVALILTSHKVGHNCNVNLHAPLLGIGMLICAFPLILGLFFYVLGHSGPNVVDTAVTFAQLLQLTDRAKYDPEAAEEAADMAEELYTDLPMIRPLWEVLKGFAFMLCACIGFGLMQAARADAALCGRSTIILRCIAVALSFCAIIVGGSSLRMLAAARNNAPTHEGIERLRGSYDALKCSKKATGFACSDEDQSHRSSNLK